MAAALQPDLTEKVVQVLQSRIRWDFDMHPIYRQVLALHTQMKDCPNGAAFGSALDCQLIVLLSSDLTDFRCLAIADSAKLPSQSSGLPSINPNGKRF